MACSVRSIVGGAASRAATTRLPVVALDEHDERVDELRVLGHAEHPRDARHARSGGRVGSAHWVHRVAPGCLWHAWREPAKRLRGGHKRLVTHPGREEAHRCIVCRRQDGQPGAVALRLGRLALGRQSKPKKDTSNVECNDAHGNQWSHQGVLEHARVDELQRRKQPPVNQEAESRDRVCRASYLRAKQETSPWLWKVFVEGADGIVTGMGRGRKVFTACGGLVGERSRL